MTGVYVKTAGIIGGIGPESTIDYYRELLKTYREGTRDEGAPSLLINSIDLHRIRTLFEQNRLTDVVPYLVHEIDKLQRGGADFGLIAAVTPHIVFDEVRDRVRLPLISIVEATCRAAVNHGMRRVAIFGTRFTMQAAFFPEMFSKAQIRVITPALSEQDYIHEVYFGELAKGVFLASTRDRLLGIVERLQREEGADGLVLGGTELPLLLKNESHSGIKFLNTTRIHVEAAVEELLS